MACCHILLCMNIRQRCEHATTGKHVDGRIALGPVILAPSIVAVTFSYVSNDDLALTIRPSWPDQLD